MRLRNISSANSGRFNLYGRAPSLIPRKPGEKVKTDRRDAKKLAQLLRSGELTPVWVPDENQEALRDMVRAREDTQEDIIRKRNQISKFLLRLEKRPPHGVKAWTIKYWQWLNSMDFKQAAQGIVLKEYIHALEEAEAGDLSRFDSPKQLMSYVGLVPSEFSSAGSRHQGRITKSGNAHIRRVIVESAWHYRRQPAVGTGLRKRQEGQSEEIKAISWQAQYRLNLKFRRLSGRGKPSQTAAVAVARELLGFMWAISQEIRQQNNLQKIS